MTTIPCPVRRSVERNPEAAAVLESGKTLTYTQYDRRISAAARQLQKLGIQPGTRVAVYAQASTAVLILLPALFRLKAVACLLNLREPVPALASRIKMTGCKILFAPSSELETLKDLPGTRFPTEYLLTGDPDDEPAGGDPVVDFDQEATVIFTSGSTSEPKAILHSYGNHYDNALGSNELIPVTAGDRWLLSLPLYHVSGIGIMFRCFLGGGTVVVPQDKEDQADAISRYEITHASFVPTQLQRLLDRPNGPQTLKLLKAILLGGAPIPPGLTAAARRHSLKNVYCTYGLSEMASQVATGPITTDGNFCARILLHRDAKISPEGEILVNGKTLFLGYLSENKIHRPLTPDGWFATGDLGKISSEGGLTVTGRKDNMFISGGENISPEEIELALGRLNGVRRALVVAVEDRDLGQRPVAFLDTAPGAAVTETHILRELRNALSGYKIPRTYYLWPAEATQGLKVSKKLFRQMAETGTGLTRLQ
ncbi:MAG: o-succinylbenzoate--CoA ligase [Candidatus Omnitrophota bacterium]|nr:o-succinylbenzoate--CoA ligase [Candidatus Omnitrophota bacterium]MDZ4242164.1 o-succinylbenzoate--CoA ligase [Candidatus Omnitrophota bacterium]